MARYHSGGFINREFYFNIGTEEQRGRDGDTARIAAQKYNDHRHSAYVAVSASDMRNWKNEIQVASTDPLSGNRGGLLADADSYLRLPGDLAELNSVLYASTSSGLRSISSGFGVHIDMAPEFPEIVEDYVTSSVSMLKGARPPQGTACLFALNGDNHKVPFRYTVADCVVYPTVRAGSGQVNTQIAITAGLKITGAPERPDGSAFSQPPRVGILLVPKRHEYDTQTNRIGSVPTVESNPVTVTTVVGGPADGVANSLDDVGHIIEGVLSLPGNFVGLLELELQFDIDGCYTADDYTAVAAAAGVSVDQLKSDLCTWAETAVSLDLVDASARIVCTFKGQ